MSNNLNDLKIFHIDMDAFYASVEEVDNPSIRNYPVIVGGKSDSGIVTTANYKARKYGIHSAMPIFLAKQKCPHGIYLPTRKDRYSEASKEVFEVLYSFTDLVEPVSIDEAYMDISNINEDPLVLAGKIKDKVYEETKLTMSIGISYNKFLAKLASDWQKPNGITIIDKTMLPDILLPLKIQKIHGIGPKSAQKLNSIGIYTVKDLYSLDEEFLEEMFGKAGREIYKRIRGVDDREININRERKSLGTERTLKESTVDLKLLKKYLKEFAKEISDGLNKRGLFGRTITVKIKDKDFKVTTRSKTLTNDTDSFDTIYYTAITLFNELNIKKEIRLIGLTISNLTEYQLKQLSI
ncbi:MAG TPA: DNA polymerase IV, partial [Tissierellaceae bacterium]